MVNFAASAAMRKKMDTVLPAIQQKVTDLGGAGKRKDLEALYGRQIIAMAVAMGHFKSITVMRKDKPTSGPIEKYSVICTDAWDRKKTYWME